MTDHHHYDNPNLPLPVQSKGYGTTTAVFRYTHLGDLHNLPTPHSTHDAEAGGGFSLGFNLGGNLCNGSSFFFKKKGFDIASTVL